MKKDLLKHYMKKNPRLFYQIDGIHSSFYCKCPMSPDDENARKKSCEIQEVFWKSPHVSISPDDDGECIKSCETFELMSGKSEVRVLIKPEINKNIVIRLLEKILARIKDDNEFMEGVNDTYNLFQSMDQNYIDERNEFIKRSETRRIIEIYKILTSLDYTEEEISTLAKMPVEDREISLMFFD